MSLSIRGQSSITPRPNYQKTTANAWQDVYSPTNTEGFINLSIAENSRSQPLVVQRLSEVPPIPSSELVYTSMHGSLATRTAIASFLSRKIYDTTVSASNIALLAGAGAVIDVLSVTLADASDAALVTGPGYRGFETLIGGRAGVKLVIVPTDVDADVPPRLRVSRLDAAWRGAGGYNSRIRYIVLASPDNPTGKVYGAETIRAIVSWARARSLHIVFDEVYALSVYDKCRSFTSVVTALDNELRDDVHVVWSLSKDFCASGMRVGVLYTQNKAILSAISSNLAYFASISRQSQWSVTNILSDEAWVDMYVVENRRRLRAAKKHCVLALTNMGIPFAPASAGFFLWIDLRKFMEDESVKAELNLWKRFADVKVLFTPASECFGSKFGFFRLCFAAVSENALNVALHRMEHVLVERAQ